MTALAGIFLPDLERCPSFWRRCKDSVTRSNGSLLGWVMRPNVGQLFVDGEADPKVIFPRDSLFVDVLCHAFFYTMLIFGQAYKMRAWYQ
jgi:hypothetical protein